MKYTVKRIDVVSTLRVGLALGWLVALFPSLALAWLAVTVLHRLNDALGRVTPYELSVLGQTIARLDLLQLLGLAGLVQSIARLAGSPLTFLLLAALLTLAGAAIVVVTLLAFCLCYNLLAALAGGIKLELEAA